ncbi:MAG TPA: protein-tyrosine phosphatase family protein [Xanthobacteraceae bacterium]
MIHVCSLSRLHATVEATGARHVVTLLGMEDHVPLPPAVQPGGYLRLHMHDICEPMDGYLAPDADHVERLVDFVQSWNRTSPLVIHCYAGISRSTAAAFTAVCALNPRRDERAVAQALRRASRTAFPNSRLVSLADDVLGREGRMVAAIEAIGRGMPALEAAPFRLELE